MRIGAGPGAVRSPTVDVSPGVTLPARAAAARDRESLGSPPYCPIVFSPCRHLQAFPSLHCGRAEGRGPRPRALIGTKPPGRSDNADRSPAPAPQSKPVTPASRLVAQETPLVASGLGLRILAAGPATYRQYSYRQRCVRQSQIHRDWHEIVELHRGDARSTKLAGYTPPSWLPHRAISDILGNDGNCRLGVGTVCLALPWLARAGVVREPGGLRHLRGEAPVAATLTLRLLRRRAPRAAPRREPACRAGRGARRPRTRGASLASRPAMPDRGLPRGR